MPRAIRLYVQYMDAISTRVGQATLYLVFAMMAILLLSSIARTVFNYPLLWAVESAQFTMSAYYMLGGAFSMLLHSHVRMDVFYGRWTTRKRGVMDSVTSLFLLFYLGVLLYGGISSTAYSIEYGQRNYSAWAPLMWPIKVIMVAGIALMLLQAVAMFFKDLAQALGKELS